MKYDFYRPHKRVTFDNSYVDKKTGEVMEYASMTKQSFVAECDINNILKQYKATGMVTHLSSRASQGVYADLPDSVDFQESLHIVRRSEEAFATLPSSLRARFENNPEAFLAFCSDPANAEEMLKLGLRKAPPPPIPEAGGAAPPAKPPQSPPVAGSASEPPKPDKA